ncbi:MAG: hypothetical protein NOU37_01975 [Candidatus Brocadiales bacterium]|nr:hypothetical protein [Candidatus Bathyanammoxibius amoris]
MERGIDLIIWAVLLLLLFGANLIKTFLKWRAGQRKEARKPVADRERHTFMEELKKTLKKMMPQQEGPEIIVEEAPPEWEEEYVEGEAVPPYPPVPKSPVKDEGRVTLTPLDTVLSFRERKKVSLSEMLPKDKLQRAIVMSEILGPPRAKRRTHRLF